uniref:Nuclear receptor-binding factor 2 C-terminal domain-containing protein n=1 Tax=Pygocentrus nattereri TaxID=42514 RepID=A0A3B4CAW1_PYGNA
MSRSTHQRHVAPQTVQELADALVQVWEEIPQETIHHLIRSMPRRCREVKLSLELQRGRHLQQQRLIRDTWKKGKLAKKPSIYTKETPLPPTQSPPATLTTSPKAIWCVAQESPQGCKAAKDDCTRLEEQSMAIADLRKALAVLLKENEKLLEENESLKVENARLKRDSYTDQQSPLLTPLLNSVEATQWPLLLDLPLLHLPPDLQEEIRLLWD